MKGPKNGKSDANSVLVEQGADVLRSSVLAAIQELEETPSTVAEPKTESSAKADHASTPSVRTEGDRITYLFADRSYEIDGLVKNRAPGSLSVTVHVRYEGRLFADKIEVYSEKERSRFIRSCAASLELQEEMIRSDFHRLHVSLRERQDALLQEAEKPKTGRVVPPMSEADRREALELLQSGDLTETIIRHFRESGYVGEETNLLAGYIVATSRLLSRPLHVLYQSSSAAGKTTLMKAVVSMMPPEVVFGYTAVSPKALQYMQDRDLRHSIFLLEEDRRLDDAAREMIKLLKSEGRATSAVTIKDPESGMMRAVDFVVEGPMCFLMTTTTLAMDEEQSNRDLVCSADESREQTKRILEMQRILCTLEGRSLLDRRAELRHLHQNAQRLLRPLTVINPFARQMTFPEHAHRLRRDHEKYLCIIEAVTLLHQYQRTIETHVRPDGTVERYIEVTPADIEIANRMAASLLGRSLDDCPPHTRSFLEQAMRCIEEEAKRRDVQREAVRLTAAELARYTGLSVQMVRRHLGRLMDLELAYTDEKKTSPFRHYVILASEIHDGNVLPGLLKSQSLYKGQKKLRHDVSLTGNSKKATGNSET